MQVDDNTIFLAETNDIANLRLPSKYSDKIILMDKADQDSSVGLQSFSHKERILDDFRLQLLSERFDRAYRNGFEVFCKGNDIVDSALSATNRLDIQELYAVYTPHTFAAYLFIKTLESMGVRCYQTQLSPLPWIYSLINGITKKQSIVELNHINSKPSQLQLDQVRTYIANKRGEYDAAKPYYEKSSRALKNETAFRNTISQISPRAALHLITRKVLAHRYKKSTRIVDNGNPHILFFLHYQPEANTLPGAGLLVDQLNAIIKIRKSTPLDHPIFVREHPSIFQKSTTTRYRFKSFYKRLTSLENVFCIDNNDEPFKLIDKATIVASISGNVITESICRQKPVIHFNSRKFAYLPPLFAIDGNTSIDALSTFIRRKIKQTDQITDEQILSALSQYLRSGINGQSTTAAMAWPESANQQLHLAKTAYEISIKLFQSDKFTKSNAS